MVWSVLKKASGAQDARKEWCRCADELSEMIHLEAKTNPRYKDMKSDWNEPPPSPPE